jgi:hypothetical protein
MIKHRVKKSSFTDLPGSQIMGLHVRLAAAGTAAPVGENAKAAVPAAAKRS